MTLDLFQPLAETQKERVNAAIVETPPHVPGVYTMYGKSDEVLYIGKAKNLYRRITSYRYAKSGKVQSLVAQISRIGFEICKTETDAVLLENLLIRSLRPPFNHVNKKPETYYYISTKRRGNKREFRLSMRVLDDYPKVYGCFKGHGRVRKGLGSLLKLLFLKEQEINSAHFLPAQLLNRLVPMRYVAEVSVDVGTQIHQFLLGKSDSLLKDLEGLVADKLFIDRFTKNYFLNEIELLKMFYALGPERNRQIYDELNLDSRVIRQDHLDDFQAML